MSVEQVSQKVNKTLTETVQSKTTKIPPVKQGTSKIWSKHFFPLFATKIV
jgi:hypothetical protein